MYVIMDGARGEMHDVEEATESSLLKLGAGASIAGSVSGEAEEPEVCIRFEDEEDGARFVRVLVTLQWCMLVYIMATAVTICSSNYTKHASKMDAVLLTMDIMTIDISSCFFVLGGYVSTYVYSSVGHEMWGEVRKRVVAQQFGNMWVSTVLCLLFGSIDKALKHRLHAKDAVLTLVEGITGLRVFDAKQSVDEPHTFNVSMWPVQSFVWCLLSVHGTYRTNEYLRSKFGDVANYIISGMGLCGITLFTLFGMLHSNTNVFYVNATSIMYRMLEFNLGVHAFYLLERSYTLLVGLTRILAQIQPVMYAVFVATWWSEIGVTGQTDTKICLRLYPRNNCLRDHHAFLLRGCVLGLTVMSSVQKAPKLESGAADVVAKAVKDTRVLATCVAMSWSAYVITQLVFEMTFSPALVFENGALMSLLMPAILYATCFVYTHSVQTAVTDVVEAAGRRVENVVSNCFNAVCGSVLGPTESA